MAQAREARGDRHQLAGLEHVQALPQRAAQRAQQRRVRHAGGRQHAVGARNVVARQLADLAE